MEGFDVFLFFFFFLFFSFCYYYFFSLKAHLSVMVRDGLPGSLLPDSSQVCACAMRLSTENEFQWLL